MAKGFGKRGRPKLKDYSDLKKAQALVEAPTVKEAYKKLHPNQSEATVDAHYTEIVTPEVLEKMKNILQLEYGGKTTRDKIEKVLWLIIARWMNKQERTENAIACLKELERLCPEFKDRFEGEVMPQSVGEIDAKLKELGFDPEKLPRN